MSDLEQEGRMETLTRSTWQRGRPTTYKGIQMRSRLEARVAAAMDAYGLTWQYEPRCFADESGQYLPDFLVGDNTYIEVKPLGISDDEVLATQRRMDIIHSSVPGALLWLWSTDGDANDDCSKHGIDGSWTPGLAL